MNCARLEEYVFLYSDSPLQLIPDSFMHALQRNMVTCSHCQKRFHPLCAAKKKYFVSRSVKFEWKFYCSSHPPPDAVFDEDRQSWITLSILSQLQDLRRSLERGRMLQEMARQRDRQHKRLLNMCEWRNLEASVEIVLKKRPTPLMKEIYHSITGEVLADTRRHKSALASPPMKRPASKQVRSRQLTLMQSMHGKSAVSEDDIDENESAHSLAAGKRRAATFSANSRMKRQRVGSVVESPASTLTEAPARRTPRFQKPSVVESDASEEEEDGPDMKTVFLSWLEDSSETTDDFDDVVANAYPQVVRSRSGA